MRTSLLPLLLAAILTACTSRPVLAFLPAPSSSSPCARSCNHSRLLINVRGGGGGPSGGGSGSGAPVVLAMAATTRRSIVAGVGGSILSLLLIGEIYSRFGSRDVASLVFGGDDEHDQPTLGADDRLTDEQWRGMEEVTLVFHGAGGQDEYTDELMANLRAKCSKTQHAAMIDWSALSSNILQASFNGQRVGRETARRLLERCNGGTAIANTDAACRLKAVHLIGISVGAFAANEACAVIKSSRLGNGITCQLTLLDPFQQRGVIGTGYGNANFGKTADYAIHFLNTDDPVPSTNAPLTKHCSVVDITNLRPEKLFGHDWPVVYYGGIEKRRNGAGGGTLGIVPEKDRLAPGTVIVADKPAT